MRSSSLDAHARLVLAIALALSACDAPAPVTPDAGPGDSGPLPSACGTVTDVTLGLGPQRITGTLDQPHERIELRDGCGTLEGAAVDVIALHAPEGGELSFTLANEITPATLAPVVEVRGACTDRIDGVCHDAGSGTLTLAPGETVHLVIAAAVTGSVPYAIDLDPRVRTQPVITAASVRRFGGGRWLSFTVEGTDAGGDAIGVRRTVVSHWDEVADLGVLPFEPTATVSASRTFELPDVANDWTTARDVTFHIVDASGDESEPRTVTVIDAVDEGRLGDACDDIETCGISLVCEEGACALTEEARAVCDAAETIVLEPGPPIRVNGRVPGFFGELYPECVTGVGGEVVYRVVLPSTGRFDLIAHTQRPMTDEYANIALWLATACGDPSTEITAACEGRDGSSLTTSWLEHLDATPGSTLVLGVDRGHERDVARLYELELALRPVRSPGESCDAAGLTDRCAGAPCADGNCP